MRIRGAALAIAALSAALLLAACARPAVEPPVRAERKVAPKQAKSTGAGKKASKKKVTARVVRSGGKKSRKVALTFDLCETPGRPAGYDAGVVEALVADNVPATFFMGGHWAETHPEEARYLGGRTLFEIGNHGYAHRRANKLSKKALRADLQLAQGQIERFTGRIPVVYRFPYGEYDKDAVSVVASAGLVPVQWNVETKDPENGVGAEDIVETVRRKAKGGSIVIMHANGRGVNTAEALPQVVALLRAQGYELVTVSDLLAD